jgi:hypothetical protein
MPIEVKMFPKLGGWNPSYKELFLEFTGSDEKKYRTGLRPKEYPFYAGVPIVNGVPDFSQAVFSVDKYGNVRMKNAYIEGTIIAGANSEIDWSYIKNVLVQTAQIANLAVTNEKVASLDAGKITTGYLSADRIAAGSITANKLNVSQLSAISANLGSITAGSITGVTITGGTIQTSTSGQRVVLDSNNWIRLYDSTGVEVGRIFGYLESPYHKIYIFNTYYTAGGGILIGDNLVQLDADNVELGCGGLKGNTNALYYIDSSIFDLGTSTKKFRHLYLSGTAYVDGTVDTTYLIADYLGQSLNANVYDITNLRYLYFNQSYGRFYWGSNWVVDFRYTSDSQPNNTTGWARWDMKLDLIPAAPNSGQIGYATNYWSAIRANTYYGKVTTIQSFQNEDDIKLIKNIKTKRGSDEYFDVSTIPKIGAKNGLYNMGALNGLIIGALKQLTEKVENLENKINELGKNLA